MLHFIENLDNVQQVWLVRLIKFIYYLILLCVATQYLPDGIVAHRLHFDEMQLG